jgi:glycosyltransferase involved in cell wall biosynthesis
MNPLVSVICICYNHERFVREALNSVKSQTYSNIQLIIVDDGSRDGSVRVIEDWLKENPGAQFLNSGINSGYCKAFNKAFALAKGEFIIDLSGDDMLMPSRVEEGVNGFLAKDERCGIQFSDAFYIDSVGKVIKKHSDQFPHDSIPEGDVYSEVIRRYFICSPTLMIRKIILNNLGGYDEQLYYEDFDLWVRAARDYSFFYTPKPLVQKRVLDQSLGKSQYQSGSKQMDSTYRVCLKIMKLNRNPEERDALNQRIRYELKWNFRLGHLRLVLLYLALLVRNNF